MKGEIMTEFSVPGTKKWRVKTEERNSERGRGELRRGDKVGLGSVNYFGGFIMSSFCF